MKAQSKLMDTTGMRWYHWIVLVLLFTIAGFGLFWGLGKPMLWEDEAETALVGRNTLQYGYPTPWDGTTLVTQQQGHDARQIGNILLWTWHPPLQYYLIGLSFKALGESPFSARLPFAICGFLGMGALAAAAWSINRSPRFMLTATALAVGMVPLYLYLREARYYGPLFLGGALVAWGIARLARAQPGGITLFGIGTLIAVLSHTLSGLVISVVGTVFVVLETPGHFWTRTGKLLAALMPTIIFAGGWLWLSNPGATLDYQLAQSSTIPTVWLLILKYHTAFFPFIGWIALMLLFPRRTHDGDSHWYLLMAPFVLAFSIWLVQVVGLPPHARYLVGVVPFTTLVLAYILWRVGNWSLVAGLILTLVVATTTVAGTLGDWAGQLIATRRPPVLTLDDLSLVPRFTNQLRAPFPGTLEGIAAFLGNLANPTDRVLTNYEREAVQFGTGLAVLQEQRDLAQLPEWLIPRPNVYFWTLDSIPPGYDEYILDVPNTPVENLPELGEHYFTLPANAPRLIIYHRHTAPMRVPGGGNPSGTNNGFPPSGVR